jgi:hypothetical protein
LVRHPQEKEDNGVKHTTIYVLWAVVVLGGIYTTLTAIRFVGNRIACHTERKLKIEDPSGFIFEVEDTTCHTLASDENVRVYVRKATPTGTWAFLDRRTHRTLLFRYDPGRWDNPLPTITRPSQSTILISIPEVSSIVEQSRTWENMSVDYHIGRVDYPAPSK